MRDDILFHVTTQEDWKQNQKGGLYRPESLEEEGFIHCSSGSQLEETANRIYGDKDQILLLVIDASRIREDVKYEKDVETGQKFPHIYAPLNVNAVIDKIEIHAEKDGTFKINFSID